MAYADLVKLATRSLDEHVSAKTFMGGVRKKYSHLPPEVLDQLGQHSALLSRKRAIIRRYSKKPSRKLLEEAFDIKLDKGEHIRRTVSPAGFHFVVPHSVFKKIGHPHKVGVSIPCKDRGVKIEDLDGMLSFSLTPSEKKSRPEAKRMPESVLRNLKSHELRHSLIAPLGLGYMYPSLHLMQVTPRDERKELYQILGEELAVCAGTRNPRVMEEKLRFHTNKFRGKAVAQIKEERKTTIERDIPKYTEMGALLLRAQKPKLEGLDRAQEAARVALHDAHEVNKRNIKTVLEARKHLPRELAMAMILVLRDHYHGLSRTMPRLVDMYNQRKR